MSEPMTREQAQKFLADEMDVLETMNLGPPEWRAQFRDAIAALEAEPPCACGGIEEVVKMLEESGWYVARVGGETSWTDTKPPVPTYYLALCRTSLPAKEEATP